tara:strand:+ start:736 stop:1026 length:291 start_codon:yes stop_codon:yes gene_type:complete
MELTIEKTTKTKETVQIDFPIFKKLQHDYYAFYSQTRIVNVWEIQFMDGEKYYSIRNSSSDKLISEIMFNELTTSITEEEFNSVKKSAMDYFNAIK